MSAKRKRVVRYTDSAMGIDAMVDYYVRINKLNIATWDTLEALENRPAETVGRKYKIIMTVEEVQ